MLQQQIRTKWFWPEMLQLVSDSVFCKKYPAIVNVFSGTCWDLKILNSIKEPLTAAVEVRSWTYHFPHICNERHLLVSFCKLSLSRFVAATFQAKLSLSWIVAATFQDKFNLSWNVAATFQDKLRILWNKQFFLQVLLTFSSHFLLWDSLYVLDTDILKRHRSGLAFSGFRDHWYKVPVLHRGHHRQLNK